MIEVRAAMLDDAVEIRDVSRATGQPEHDSGADPRYVRFLLDHGRVVVAVREGRIRGWGAVRAGALGEMLTDLFVVPDGQGAGIGRALLGSLWPSAEAGRRFTFSSRHPHALPLYARAGLQPQWPLLYFRGDPSRLPASRARVEALGAAPAAEAEQALLGADRAVEYRYWVTEQGAQPFVARVDGQIVAAGARAAGRLIHLGCADAETADDAVYAALRSAAEEPATVCLPGPHPAVRTMLDAGWRIDDYDLAMTTADLALAVTWAYSPALA